MKKLVSGTILFLLLISVVSTDAAQKKVLVVQSVAKETSNAVSAYPLIYEGIKQALKQKKLVPEFMFVDLSSAPDVKTKTASGKKAIEKIRQSQPDVIITINDDSVKYIGTGIDDIPVVFGYIFSSPEALGLPRPNITGVLRRSYAPDIWKLAHKLFGADTVSMLSKTSLSMAGVKKSMNDKAEDLYKLSSIRFKDMYLCDTFDQWQKYVQNWSEDFIYLADTSRILKDDKTISSEETVGWTVKNAKVPVVAATEKDTQAGALYAIVTYEKEIGWQAGYLALEILEGKKPSELPYISSSKGKLIINAKTAIAMGIEIPYDILSMADKIYE